MHIAIQIVPHLILDNADFFRQQTAWGLPLCAVTFISFIIQYLPNQNRNQKRQDRLREIRYELDNESISQRKLDKLLAELDESVRFHPIAEKQGKRDWTIIIGRAFAVMFCILSISLISLYWIANRDAHSAAPTTSSSAPTSNVAAAITPFLRTHLSPAQDDTKLVLVDWHWNEDNWYAVVEGRVKNISATTLGNVEAVIDTYTSSRDFVTSGDASIVYNPILPGQTSRFKVIASYNPEMKRIRIHFRDFMGHEIATSSNPSDAEPSPARNPFLTFSLANMFTRSQDGFAHSRPVGAVPLSTIAEYSGTIIERPARRAGERNAAGNSAPRVKPLPTSTKTADSTLTPPPTFFTVGSSRAEVITVQGQPDVEGDTTLTYGLSTVILGEGGRVTAWTDASKILHAKYTDSD